MSQEPFVPRSPLAMSHSSPTRVSGPRIHDAHHGHGLARPRQPTAAAAMPHLANLLFLGADPSQPEETATLRTQEVQRYYCQALFKQPFGPSLTTRLATALSGGDRLFIRGEVPGVGASTLVTDYVRLYNHQCTNNGSPSKAIYQRIAPKSDNPRHFLDALAVSAGVPLTTTELARRSPDFLVERLLATLRMRDVSCIVIDEVGNAGKALLSFLAELVHRVDPAYRIAPGASATESSRIGVVLVDYRPAEILFRRHVDGLFALEGNQAVLRRYGTVHEVWEALRVSGINLDDCGAHRDDQQFAQLLLNHTSGLPAHMTPLLRLVDQIARYDNRRPDLACLEAARQVHKPLVAVHTTQVDTRDADRYESEAVAEQPGHHGGAHAVARRAPLPRAVLKQAPLTRLERIAVKKHDVRVAEAEQKDMARSGKVIL